MTTTTEHITVIIEGITKGFDKAAVKARQGLDRLRQNIGAVNHVMGMNMGMFKKTAPHVNQWGNKYARLAGRLRLATHGMRGFKMEMLGVMFFGMGLQRFFTGLLRPALEITGVFKLWTTVLQVLFLPIVLKLLPYILRIADWVMGWSEKTKVLIGKLVIFGAIAGVVLFLVGMLALGIGSLILVLSGLFNIISHIIPNFNILGVEMSGFVEAGLMIGLVTKAAEWLKGVFNDILSRLLEMDMIKEVFERLGITIDESKTPWENLKTAIITAWDEIKAQLNLDTEFGKIEGLFGEEGLGGWIGKVELAANTWLDDMKAKLDELGMDDLVESIKKLGKEIGNALPDIEDMAKALTTIAGAITAVADFFSMKERAPTSEWELRTPEGEIVTSSATTRPISTSYGNFTLSPTYNISVGDKAELERMLSDLMAGQVTDLQKLTAGG